MGGVRAIIDGILTGGIDRVRGTVGEPQFRHGFMALSLPVAWAVLVFGNTARAAEFVKRDTREWVRYNRKRTGNLLERLANAICAARQ